MSYPPRTGWHPAMTRDIRCAVIRVMPLFRTKRISASNLIKANLISWFVRYLLGHLLRLFRYFPHECERYQSSCHCHRRIRHLGTGCRRRLNGRPASVTSCFRRDVDETCALLRYHAASSFKCLPTFRDSVSVPSSSVKTCKTRLVDPCRWDWYVVPKRR
jgi:hypothetical protein